MRVFSSLIVCCAGLSASAQNQYIPTPVGTTNASVLLNGGTNFIAANSTNTYDFPIDLRLYNDFAMEWSFRLISGGTSNVVLNFDKSVSGTNWVPVYSWVLGANGTNLLTDIVQNTVSSVGWWRLHTGVNTNSIAVTNFTLLKEPKPRRVN